MPLILIDNAHMHRVKEPKSTSVYEVVAMFKLRQHGLCTRCTTTKKMREEVSTDASTLGGSRCKLWFSSTKALWLCWAFPISGGVGLLSVTSCD